MNCTLKCFLVVVNVTTNVFVLSAIAQPGIRMIGQPVFYPNDSLVRSLSDDGSVAAGRNTLTSQTGPGGTFFRNSIATGYEEYLPPSSFRTLSEVDISGDASVLVGYGLLNDPQGNHVIRGFHVQNGVQTIIQPPTGFSNVTITAVSRNGLFAAGVIPLRNSPYYRAVRWSAARGTELLPEYQNGQDIVGVYEVSDQGDIISVTGNMSGFRYATRYNYVDRSMQILQPFPTSPFPDTYASIITRDSEYVYGSSGAGSFDFLARWDRSGSITNLGRLPNWNFMTPFAGSDDGSIIIGSASRGFSTIPFVYSATEGWFTIADYLAHHSIPIPSGWTIDYLASVSGDGRTFGGQIVHPTLGKVAFTATVPTPALPVIMGLAGLFATRRCRAKRA